MRRSLLISLLVLAFFICQTASAVNVMIASDTTSAVVPGTITFTGSVSGNETDVSEWSWQFNRVGDPSAATRMVGSGRVVTKTFDRAGTYRVILYTMVDGKNFQSNPYDIMIYDTDYVPVPEFEASPVTGTAPLTVIFRDTSQHLPTNWHWTFGDGATGTGQTVVHTYTEPGSYSVTLAIDNPAGRFTKTFSNHITVNTPPAALFSVDRTSGELPLTIRFTDESTGGITSWLWDFGDGSTSTLQHPSHTYTKKGTYTVTLKAENKYGTATITKNNLITTDVNPVVDFGADQQRGGAPLTVRFTDLSGGSPNQWRWDFGDGRSSIQQNPTHTYTHPGTFRVQLTASGTNVAGSLTRTGYIVVRDQPTAAFDAEKTFGNAPLTIRFSDRSTGGPEEWRWEFGDGSGSSERHPTHTYTEEGTYSVLLTIKNSDGSDWHLKEEYITVMKPAPTPDAQTEDIGAYENRQGNETALGVVPALNISIDIPFVNPKDLGSEYIMLIKAVLDRLKGSG
jgi:FOG: PKD repeat